MGPYKAHDHMYNLQAAKTNKQIKPTNPGGKEKWCVNVRQNVIYQREK